MSLKIFAVGDIMLGEQPLCNNIGVSSIIKRRGVGYLFENTRPIFYDGDIVMGNLECSIVDKKLSIARKPLFFCAENAVVEGLIGANFNVLSIANNHIMDHGDCIFQNTIQSLKNYGIQPVGVSNKIELLSINGYKVAILAYSLIEDGTGVLNYNKVCSEEPIIAEIKSIKPFADLIIISLHWGFEYVSYPSPDQVKIGRKLIDAGADIILGGHPHVTQSYEIYKCKPIFYSLGNFIFDDTYIPLTRDSFIAEISINDSLDSIRVNIIPVTIDMRDYKPRIVNASESQSFLENIDAIRNKIENRSLTEYTKSIGDYNSLYTKCAKDAKRNMKRQFLKNWYHYSPLVTLNIIKHFVWR